MSKYIGDIKKGKTVNYGFNSFNQGVLVTITGTPALRSQRLSDGTFSNGGLTLSVNFSGITGYHRATIDTSNSHFVPSADYSLMFQSGLIAGGSIVGSVIGNFSVENRNNRVDIIEYNGVAAISGNFPGVIPTELLYAAGEVIETTGGAINANLVSVDNSTNGVSAFARAINSITLGVADSGCTATNILTTSLSPAAAATDQFKGLILAFDKNTASTGLRGQKTDITGSTTAGVLQVTSLSAAPIFGDTFAIE